MFFVTYWRQLWLAVNTNYHDILAATALYLQRDEQFIWTTTLYHSCYHTQQHCKHAHTAEASSSAQICDLLFHFFLSFFFLYFSVFLFFFLYLFVFLSFLMLFSSFLESPNIRYTKAFRFFAFKSRRIITISLCSPEYSSQVKYCLQSFLTIFVSA